MLLALSVLVKKIHNTDEFDGWACTIIAKPRMKSNGVSLLLVVGIVLVHLGSNLIEARSHHWNRVKPLAQSRDQHENITNSTEEHEHWKNTSSVDWILDHFDLNADGALDPDEFEAYFTSIFPFHDHDHDHDEDHDEDHEQRNVAQRDHEEIECPSEEELFSMWDADHDGLLAGSELRFVSADMLIMLQLGCGEVGHEEEEECEPPTTAQKWGYGTLAAVVITLISAAGIIILPINNGTFKSYFVLYSTSFAIGALLGDAILHILPLVWGIHGHEEEGHAHEEEEESLGNEEVLLRGLVVGAGFALFYLLEILVRMISERVGAGNGGHSHGGDIELEDKSAHKTHVPGHHHNIVPREPVSTWKEIKPIGWLNLFSDALHNFADGLAIGAAFSISTSTGLATTIAIGCHEIPQEFADFGILLHAGFSKAWAIAFNLLCGATCILATFIGLGIGEASEDAEVWILALTAGGFIYIALVEMLPFLIEATAEKPRTAFIILFWAVLGWFILFIIAWFEDQLGGCGGH